MTGEQAALAQRANRLRVTPRERAALGLHIPQPGPGRGLRERPRHRSQLTVQREHRNRSPQGQPQPLLLHRRYRVLEARVVELHRACTAGVAPGEAAGEVRVDDVEPARTQAEVQRLHVDDHLVARLCRTHQRQVGDGRAHPAPVGCAGGGGPAGSAPACPHEFDPEVLLEALRARAGSAGVARELRRVGLDHHRTTKLEHPVRAS